MNSVFFLIVTNIAMVVSISIITSLLGVNQYITAQGLNYQMLLAFCVVWGFAGSLIALMISKPMAKRAMRVKLLDGTENAPATWLVSTVRDLAEKSGIGMPDVGLYQGAPNAFATGMNKNKALIAVSTGLLETMNKAQVEAVLAHEVGHVASGDMVTQTLVQGTVNAFTMFISRILAFGINAVVNKDRNSSGLYHVLVVVFDLLLGFLGAMVVAYVSRRREFAADRFAAQLKGPVAMIGALESLGRKSAPLPEQMAAFGISGGKSVWSLFATHPPIESRIAALRQFKMG